MLKTLSMEGINKIYTLTLQQLKTMTPEFMLHNNNYNNPAYLNSKTPTLHSLLCDRHQ